MSSEIMPFQFGDQAIRVLELGDTVWFVAGDVAQVLGYADAKQMTRWLDEDEAALHNVQSRSENGTLQSREVTIISESGLYNAVLKSRRPEAKPFRRWVTEEVLPSIRKTGGYRKRGGFFTAPDLTKEDIRLARQLRDTVTPYLDIFIKMDRVRDPALRCTLARTLKEKHGIEIDADSIAPGVRSGRKTTPPEKKDPAELLQEFMATLLTARVGDTTVGDMLLTVVHGMPDPDKAAVEALARLGIAVKQRNNDLYFAIAARSQALAALLKGTQWSLNGSWVHVFRNAPGSDCRPARMARTITRAYLIPIHREPDVGLFSAPAQIM